MDFLCSVGALFKGREPCCKPLEDAMTSSLLFRRLDVSGRTTLPKPVWLCDLIACFLAILTVATVLFIANFGFGSMEMAP
jgi:hypothetical protein